MNNKINFLLVLKVFLITCMPIMAFSTQLPISKDGIFDTKGYKIGYKFTDEKKARAFLKRWHSREIQPFVAPTMKDLEAIKDSKKKERLKKAIIILTKTTAEISSQVPNLNTKFKPKNFACVNCHSASLKSGLPGTKPYVRPWVNVVNDYPKLDTKSMKIMSLRGRIVNMIGRIKPNDEAIDYIVEYMKWLGSFTQPRKQMEGTLLLSSKQFPMPNRSANPIAGKALYQAKCQSCHQANAEGLKSPNYSQGGGWIFPPIAGNHTYRDNAITFFIPPFAKFIYVNMPLGASSENPILTQDEAYDLAAYINSGTNVGSKVGLSRRHKKSRAGDFPMKAFRPSFFVIWEDYAKGKKDPEYIKARFGPFKEGYE